MAQEELLNDLRRRMDGALEVLRKEFGGLRTGRASTSLLEPIQVPAYGGTVPLNQVANVSVPEPRMITVQVWDRGVVKAVDKAIREAGLGLNPQTEGQTIRVPIPELNEERRRELTRVAAKYAEQARVSRSEEHTSELQSRSDLVCRLLLEKKKTKHSTSNPPRSKTIMYRITQ